MLMNINKHDDFIICCTKADEQTRRFDKLLTYEFLDLLTSNIKFPYIINFSYDNRPRNLQPAEDRHIIQSSVLQGRVTFRPGQVPALHIRPVAASDQANYTCRVDFQIGKEPSAVYPMFKVNVIF